MGPKKKLTKEERLKKKQEEEEKRRILEEEARLRAEEEERIRLEEERLRLEELERIRCEEAEIREKQGVFLLPIFKDIQEKYRKEKVNKWHEFQWHQYVHVWKSINPMSLPIVNRFLTKWVDNSSPSLKDFFPQCHKALGIIEEVDFAFTNCPILNKEKQSQWNEILMNVKTTLNKKLDFVTYSLLSSCAENINEESNNMEYGITDKPFVNTSKDSLPSMTLCLWANLVKNIRYRGMELPELGFGFELPISLATHSYAVRILHTLFDAVTTQCSKEELERHRSVIEEEENCFLEQEQQQDEEEEEEEESEVQDRDENVTKDENATEDENVSTGVQEVSEPGSAESLTSNTVSEITTFVASSSSENLATSEPSTDNNEENSSVILTTSEESIPTKFKRIAIPPLRKPKLNLVDPNEYFLVGGIYYFDLYVVPKQPVEAGAWIFVLKEKKEPVMVPYKANIIPPRKPIRGMGPTQATEFTDSEILRFNSEIHDALTLTLNSGLSIQITAMS